MDNIMTDETQTEAKTKKKTPSYKNVEETMTVGDAIERANSERESLAEEMRSWCDNMEEKFSATARFEAASAAADALEGIDEVDCGNLDDDSSGEEIRVHQSVSARKGRGESRSTRAGNAAALYEAANNALVTRAEALRAKAQEREDAENAADEGYEEEPGECDECQDTGDMDESKAEAGGDARDGWVCRACGHFHAKTVEDDYDGPDGDELNAQAEECEDVAQNCEQAKDEIEGVDFPGMFG